MLKGDDIMVKRWGKEQWRIFIEEVQETMLYTDEEVSALFNYYYETRKAKES